VLDPEQSTGNAGPHRSSSNKLYISLKASHSIVEMEGERIENMIAKRDTYSYSIGNGGKHYRLQLSLHSVLPSYP
jgi:hypothetical protein